MSTLSIEPEVATITLLNANPGLDDVQRNTLILRLDEQWVLRRLDLHVGRPDLERVNVLGPDLAAQVAAGGIAGRPLGMPY